MRCNMNFLNKMERKIGKYAIPNLMIYLIAAYCIGFVIYTVNPNFMLMLTLSPYHILHGQVWRLITWILMPTDTRVFSLLIMALLYYQLGSALERSWGTFRFNVYIFGGMLFTVIGAFILYGIYAVAGTGNLETISLISSLTFTTNYINLTIFLAFAVMYPEMQILLFFIIPVKMKWMAVVYAVLIAINMSILNFLIFFLSTRNYRRISPKEIHRKQVFKAQMREPRRGSMVTKHKCAVCGRTELDDPNLEFRFCSKCDGNYEYCQDHLYTHTHVQ